MQQSLFLSILIVLSLAVGSSAATKDVDLGRDVRAAKSVVLGNVERTLSYFGEDGEIYTEVSLQVEAKLKDGFGIADFLTFTTPGGEVGDVGVLYSSAPRFLTGEPVMVFLEEAGQGLRATAKYPMNREQIAELDMTPLDLLVEVGRVIGEDKRTRVGAWEREWQRSGEFLAKNNQATPEASAAPVCYKLLGPKWAAKSASYRLDASLPSGFAAVVSEAAASWANAGSAFKFSTDSASPNTVNYAPIATAGVLAQTRVSYQPSTNTIASFTLTFNTNYIWTTTGEAGKFDVQNVGTHELGHALGLDHPVDASCSEQTMWASASAGETKKRTLEAGDQEGQITIYGAAATATPVIPTTPALVPSFTYVYLYAIPRVNTAFKAAVLGKNFDAKTLQFVFKGPGCPAEGCVVDTPAIQPLISTQAVGPFTPPAMGDYSLYLRNGPAGALSAMSAKFSVR
ncbi:matrixin family metalloprotease [Bryobacter aggregatus]|uniref:matrixin family metalloprotease n=1 Tax=Bryobacter aggregatus TaxID=360054 RepID=UPI00068EC3F4|nr:matrixin family metalloprotease [Bryobacter aggregatus]